MANISRLSLALMLASAACGSSESTPATNPAIDASGTGGSSPAGQGGSAGQPANGQCVPGIQIACPCPGGTQGVQRCAANGSSFTMCSCAGAAGGAGGAGGAGVAGGGGSLSAGSSGTGAAGKAGAANGGAAQAGTSGLGGAGAGGSAGVTGSAGMSMSCPGTPPGGECSFFPECGCAPGKKCAPADATGKTKCTTAGSAQTGYPCAHTSDCATGLGCSVQRTCSRICDPLQPTMCSCHLDIAADGDTTPVASIKACTVGCDPASPQKPTAHAIAFGKASEACGPGVGCEHVSFGQIGIDTCTAPGGTIAVGAACTGTYSCVPGAKCDQSVCVKLCWDTGDCPTGKKCSESDTPFLGICY